MRENPLLPRVPAGDEVFYSLLLPIVGLIWFKGNAESLAKGLFYGLYRRIHRNVAAKLLSNGCDPLAKAAIALIIQFQGWLIHDLHH